VDTPVGVAGAKRYDAGPLALLKTYLQVVDVFEKHGHLYHTIYLFKTI
jgi:hypothetical protein